ncbi:hypothetical protein ACFL0L_01595 [Patescibacteria group bacterium]
MINQRGFISATLVVIIVVLAVFMVGVAWWYEENKEEVANTQVVSNESIENNSVNVKNSNAINSNAATNTNFVSNTNSTTNVNTNVTSDSGNNWRTVNYNKNDLSFLISVPADWREETSLYNPPRERYSLISYTWPPESGVTQYLRLIVRYFINDEASLKEWVDKHETHLREGEQNHNRLTELTLSEITVNGELGYAYDADYKRTIGEWDDEGNYVGTKIEHKSYKYINFQKDNKIYQIYIGGDNNLVIDNQDLIIEIIDSFNFLE